MHQALNIICYAVLHPDMTFDVDGPFNVTQRTFLSCRILMDKCKITLSADKDYTPPPKEQEENKTFLKGVF